MKSDYQILLFYKYVHIENPEAVRDWLFMLGDMYGLKGRSIVATEGLNITVEGKTEDTEEFIRELETDPRFQNINFKRSVGTGTAFPRMSVKVRKEIVTLGLGVCDIDPNQLTGVHLPAEELHKWFEEGKEFYIVDMRNVYEHKVGKFVNSIWPPLENFRDLPKVMKQLKHLKNKTVVTVCTGGVRCEKASGYLLSQGFTDVYQLENGIVTYMEKYPNEHFEGKLYVFDDRTTMGFYTDDPKHKVIGKCEGCDRPCDTFVDCATPWCAKHFVLCEECVPKYSSEGKQHCVGKCGVRKPKKLQSPFMKVVYKIKSLFA